MHAKCVRPESSSRAEKTPEAVKTPVDDDNILENQEVVEVREHPYRVGVSGVCCETDDNF